MTRGPESRVARAKAKKPELYRRISRNSQYKSLYGITLEQYEEMLEMQSGLCAVCGTPPRNELLSVEHSHTTGKIRGLVHKHCNIAIGVVEGPLYDSVVAYLERNN